MDEEDQLRSVHLKNYNKTPLNIMFNDITYKVTCKRKKREKTILENVSGYFNYGKLSGILGPSGAGKTSLLNILAGYKTQGVTGSILINGVERNLEDFKWHSAFVEQDTSLLPLLTTNEALHIAAELKLPSKLSDAQKSRIISEIIEVLALEKTLDTRACDLSGGERKRLSIGMELITNPPVMFFDEPTSGLDSISSCQVVSHLRTLAQGGRTIICVIHQPSSRLFDMFDDILVMANGKNMYGGPVSDMLTEFQLARYECPKYYNRADFALEVATRQLDGDFEYLTRSKDYSIRISNSLTIVVDSMSSRNDSLPSTATFQDDTFKLAEKESFEPKPNLYATSRLKQFWILLKRSSKCTFRDLHLTRIRVVAHLLVGLILGLIYYKIGNDAAKITNNASLLYFFLMFIYFANSMPTISTFPLEAAVFKREHYNNWYSLPSYFFSKMIADLPLQIICPIVFMVTAYTLSGQPCDCFRIAMIGIVCILFTILSQLIGLVSGVVFSMQMGLFLLPALTIPMLIFSGFFLRFDDVPNYMKFLTYLSQFGYAFEALMLAVYDYDRPDLECSTPYCQFKSPKKFLEEMDMKQGNFTTDISLLAAWTLFMQIALYAALRFRIWRFS